jgi:acyl-CoA reductase-like NAD-dependent aldehyde dehydrogenase
MSTAAGDPHGAAAEALREWAPENALFIGNEWVEPAEGGARDVTNPSTGKPVRQVADAGERDVGRAVAAADDALGAWGRLSPFDRSRLLRAVAEGIERNAETLALLESVDVGKPLEMARGEVASAIECFDYYSSLAVQIEGSTRYFEKGLGVVRREPVGTVGIITPFNFPLTLSAVKIAPALAAGCTVVHKPSEHTPLSALALARIVRDAGLPPGVYNLVTGGGDLAGAALVSHQDVAKIVFTGSTEVGVRVAAEAARTVKRVTMELGGKSANIVCADADPEQAAARAHAAYTFNAGQYCESGSRLIVESSIHDELLERLAVEAEATVVGDALETGSAMGPLIAPRALENVHAAVERGLEAGGRLVAGGGPEERGGGWFYRPTVVAEASPDSEIAQHEIFGPVVTAIPFRGLDEAIELANSTRFGLAAGIQTADLGQALRVAERLVAGTVWINDWGTGNVTFPVGGRRQSGLGREQGPEGLAEFLEYKTVLTTLRPSS